MNLLTPSILAQLPFNLLALAILVYMLRQLWSNLKKSCYGSANI
jgi:hypothetical protein